jgi:peptidyl-tRNA hydrolase
VLGRATADEQLLIDAALKRGLEVAPQIVAGDTQKAMHALHTEKT